MLGSNPGLLGPRHWLSDALTTRLDLIHTRLDHIHTRLDLIHTRLDLIHTRLDLIHTRLDHIHTRLDLIHTKLNLIHTRLDLIHKQSHLRLESGEEGEELGLGDHVELHEEDVGAVPEEEDERLPPVDLVVHEEKDEQEQGHRVEGRVADERPGRQLECLD